MLCGRSRRASPSTSSERLSRRRPSPRVGQGTRMPTGRQGRAHLRLGGPLCGAKLACGIARLFRLTRRRRTYRPWRTCRVHREREAGEARGRRRRGRADGIAAEARAHSLRLMFMDSRALRELRGESDFPAASSPGDAPLIGTLVADRYHPAQDAGLKVATARSGCPWPCRASWLLRPWPRRGPSRARRSSPGHRPRRTPSCQSVRRASPSTR